MRKHIQPKPDEMVLSYIAIRRAVGYLGLFLPVCVSLVAWITGCRQIQDSISHYYYTRSGSILVGTLCAVGLFLFTYRGFDKWDRWSSNLASLFALGVAFSPCNMSPGAMAGCIVIRYADNDIRNTIHYCSAGGLFITLALMSLFLFTKTDKTVKGKMKRVRNGVYITCGLVMVAAMLAMVSLRIPSVHDLLGRSAMYWLEWIALWAFGISWLVKGEVVLKDNKVK